MRYFAIALFAGLLSIALWPFIIRFWKWSVDKFKEATGQSGASIVDINKRKDEEKD